MKMIRLLLTTLGLIFLISFPICAGEIREGENLTLNRCLEIAFKKNPSLVGAFANVRLYQTRVRQAQSSYFPQINWQTSASRVGPYSSNLGQYSEYATNLGLSQNVFDFNRTPLKVQIANINTQSVMSDLEAAKNEVALAVKQAFYSLLQAQKNREVAYESVTQFELHLKRAKAFYEAGTRPKVDVIKAEVDLNNAMLNLIKAENSIRLARITLNNVMGIPDAPQYNIVEELTVPKELITLTEAIEEAYKSRPDLKSLTLKQEAASKALELAYKNHYPTITGSASYGFGGNEFPLGRGWNVGASVNIPIFSGFLTKYQIEEAKFNLEVIKAQGENLKNEIRRDVEQAYSNLVEARQRIRTSEAALKYAKENADLATGRYSVGLGSPIEVTDALVQLANAQTSYISALADFKQAEASLEKAMGRK